MRTLRLARNVLRVGNAFRQSEVPVAQLDIMGMPNENMDGLWGSEIGMGSEAYE